MIKDYTIFNMMKHIAILFNKHVLQVIYKRSKILMTRPMKQNILTSKLIQLVIAEFLT